MVGEILNRVVWCRIKFIIYWCKWYRWWMTGRRCWMALAWSFRKCDKTRLHSDSRSDTQQTWRTNDYYRRCTCKQLALRMPLKTRELLDPKLTPILMKKNTNSHAYLRLAYRYTRKILLNSDSYRHVFPALSSPPMHGAHIPVKCKRPEWDSGQHWHHWSPLTRLLFILYISLPTLPLVKTWTIFFDKMNSVADEPFVLIQDENVDNQISLPRRHLKIVMTIAHFVHVFDD